MDSPSISFIVDEPGWAFDRWTKCLVSELKNCGVSATRYFRSNLPKMFAEDLIYVCWWGDVEIVSARLSPEQSILCRVTDMLTWTTDAPANWQRRFRLVRPLTRTFVAASREIERALESTGNRNVVTISDCVDTTVFLPGRSSPSLDRKPHLGWCGNPVALRWMSFEDVKGIDILRSLVQCEDLDFFVATCLAPHKMPDWFRNLDIYVCASRSEGTPLSVLEALATGNIIVSTAVGIVPEIESPGVFIFDGTAADLRSVLGEVLDRREEWGDRSAANRSEARLRWSAPATAQRFAGWLCE